jgi:hypothetical protein
MPERSRKHRPTDLNSLAASIVADSVDDDKDEPADDGKDPAAVALGRRGGLKGGRARAASLTAEERSEIARKAAAARWSKPEPPPARRS